MGPRYSIFKLTDEGYELPAMIGQLDEVELQRLLQRFQDANVTVLELAATANWLVGGRRTGRLAGGFASSQGTQGQRRPALIGL